jgi:hypothetical protein
MELTMCEACEAATSPREADHRPRPELLARTREIEAATPGERVPETAWVIFFELSGGSLEWRHYIRIRMSYETAFEQMPALATAWRAMTGSQHWICEEV